jgi:hypothetical protein
MKTSELEALVEAMGPPKDNTAYHNAVREARRGIEKAERYFGCPVRISHQHTRTGPGSYVLTYTFIPAEQA